MIGSFLGCMFWGFHSSVVEGFLLGYIAAWLRNQSSCSEGTEYLHLQVSRCFQVFSFQNMPKYGLIYTIISVSCVKFIWNISLYDCSKSYRKKSFLCIVVVPELLLASAYNTNGGKESVFTSNCITALHTVPVMWYATSLWY